MNLSFNFDFYVYFSSFLEACHIINKSLKYTCYIISIEAVHYHSWLKGPVLKSDFLVLIPTLSHTGCVSLGELFDSSMPLYSSL